MTYKRSRTASESSSASQSSPLSPSSPVKIIHLDHLASSDSTATGSTASSSQPAMSITCSLPPHPPLTFPTLTTYEIHYHSIHTHRCLTCTRNFPSLHFLHLHIAENHDPITAARRDRGDKTYACLVPTCDRLCSTPPKRRLHCIDKHGFPKNYDFFILKDGIDGRRSMLRQERRRRSSTMTSIVSNGEGRSAAADQPRSGTDSSNVGVNSTASAQAMELVEDEDEDEDGDEDENELEEEGHEEDDEPVAQDEELATPKSPSRTPIKLRGRGGFGHGRGRGRAMASAISPPRASTAAAIEPNAPETKAGDMADPMDGLVSRMSALQFVPHAVRLARGRRGGRGLGPESSKGNTSST